jgi:hypothetical protein
MEESQLLFPEEDVDCMDMRIILSMIDAAARPAAFAAPLSSVDC